MMVAVAGQLFSLMSWDAMNIMPGSMSVTSMCRVESDSAGQAFTAELVMKPCPQALSLIVEFGGRGGSFVKMKSATVWVIRPPIVSYNFASRGTHCLG